MRKKRRAKDAAAAQGKLRVETRDVIHEEFDRLRQEEHVSPSVTAAVARGLAKVRRESAGAGLSQEAVEKTTRANARRVVADETDRGRRSGKKSKSTTQILRKAEHRPGGRQAGHGRRGAAQGES